MTFHFYLALPQDDVRAMTTAFLPRVGDTIHVDNVDHIIDKVTWFSSGPHIEDVPLVNVVHDQALVASSTLAESIARQYGDGGRKKIEAIKKMRAASDMGLKEAKEAMDVAFAKLGWT